MPTENQSCTALGTCYFIQSSWQPYKADSSSNHDATHEKAKTWKGLVTALHPKAMTFLVPMRLVNNEHTDNRFAANAKWSPCFTPSPRGCVCHVPIYRFLFLPLTSPGHDSGQHVHLLCVCSKKPFLQLVELWLLAQPTPAPPSASETLLAPYHSPAYSRRAPSACPCLLKTASDPHS